MCRLWVEKMGKVVVVTEGLPVVGEEELTVSVSARRR
jgi:hypothetical protein